MLAVLAIDFLKIMHSNYLSKLCNTVAINQKDYKFAKLK